MFRGRGPVALLGFGEGCDGVVNLGDVVVYLADPPRSSCQTLFDFSSSDSFNNGQYFFCFIFCFCAYRFQIGRSASAMFTGSGFFA